MLARIGALLCSVSLLLPWYVLEAGSGLKGLGKSGAAVLGVWSLVLLVLAAVAGSALVSRAQRQVPTVAATGLVLLVIVKLVYPPDVGSAFGATSGDPLASPFARVFSDEVGLHYAASWGLWLAAVGAGVALLGAISAAAAQE
jgi:hypothetical protein